jgi:hypothetical protein
MIAECGLAIAECGLSTVDCRLWIDNQQSAISNRPIRKITNPKSPPIGNPTTTSNHQSAIPKSAIGNPQSRTLV